MVRVRLWTGDEIDVEVRDPCTVVHLMDAIKQTLNMDERSEIDLYRGKTKLSTKKKDVIENDDVISVKIRALVVAILWYKQGVFLRLVGDDPTVDDLESYLINKHNARDGTIKIYWDGTKMKRADKLYEKLFSSSRKVFRERRLSVSFDCRPFTRTVFGLGKESTYSFKKRDQSFTVQDAKNELAEEFRLNPHRISLDGDDDMYENLDGDFPILWIPKDVEIHLWIDFELKFLDYKKGVMFKGDETVADTIEEINHRIKKAYPRKGVECRGVEGADEEDILFDVASRGKYSFEAILVRRLVVRFEENEWNKDVNVKKDMRYICDRIAKGHGGICGDDLCVFIKGELMENEKLVADIESNEIDARYKTILVVNQTHNTSFEIKLVDLAEKTAKGLREYIATNQGIAKMESIQVISPEEDLCRLPHGARVDYKVASAGKQYLFRFNNQEVFSLPLRCVITQDALLKALAERAKIPQRELVLKFELPVTSGVVYDFVAARRDIELDVATLNGNNERIKFPEAPATVNNAREFLHRHFGTTDDDCRYTFSCGGNTLNDTDIIPSNEVSVMQTPISAVYNFSSKNRSRKFQHCFTSKDTISTLKETISRYFQCNPKDVVTLNGKTTPNDYDSLKSVYPRGTPLLADKCSPVIIETATGRETVWFPAGSSGLDVKRHMGARLHCPVDEIELRDLQDRVIASEELINSERLIRIKAMRVQPTIITRVRNFHTQEQVTVTISKSDTVAKVLQNACEQMHAPQENASLLFAGKTLSLNERVTGLCLTGGSVLVLYTET